jgi:hypothetical protein
MSSIVHFGGLRIDASQKSRVLAVLDEPSCLARQSSSRDRPNRSKSKMDVRKSGLAGLVVLGLMAGAAVPQPNFDCGKAYKDFWQRLDRATYAKMPPEQLVVLSRKALRIYDACQTGDVEDAKGLFERLVRLAK